MTALRRAAWLAAGGLLLMWVLGCWRYTSVGFELDTLTEGVVREDYYRVRWPGDGSVLLGSGWVHLPADAKPLERFDLGAAFFHAPRRRMPESGWNRWGFWRIDVARDAPGVPVLARQGESWWGVPGWLPALAMAALALGLRRTRRVRRTLPFEMSGGFEVSRWAELPGPRVSSLPFLLSGVRRRLSKGTVPKQARIDLGSS
jgi:hypothetical protein